MSPRSMISSTKRTPSVFKPSRSPGMSHSRSRPLRRLFQDAFRALTSRWIALHVAEKGGEYPLERRNGLGRDNFPWSGVTEPTPNPSGEGNNNRHMDANTLKPDGIPLPAGAGVGCIYQQIRIIICLAHNETGARSFFSLAGQAVSICA